MKNHSRTNKPRQETFDVFCLNTSDKTTPRFHHKRVTVEEANGRFHLRLSLTLSLTEVCLFQLKKARLWYLF